MIGAVLAWRAGIARVAGVALLTVVLALPAIGLRASSCRDGEDVLRSRDELGNLPRPLDPLQIAGIWPTSDFRTDPDAALADVSPLSCSSRSSPRPASLSPSRGARGRRSRTSTTSLAGAALFVAGRLAVGRREGARDRLSRCPLRRAARLCVDPRACRAHCARRRRRGVVALGVLWSNGLAYHGATLAPHDQLAELEEIGERFAGQGPALMTEYQPYGVRHFLRRLDAEGASELRRRLVPKADGSLPQKGEAPDLDELALPGVLVYRTLVLRRSPVASRPPAPYELRWQGRWYEVWQRLWQGRPSPRTFRSATRRSPGAAADCADVLGIATERSVRSRPSPAPARSPCCPRGRRAWRRPSSSRGRAGTRCGSRDLAAPARTCSWTGSGSRARRRTSTGRRQYSDLGSTVLATRRAHGPRASSTRSGSSRGRAARTTGSARSWSPAPNQQRNVTTVAPGEAARLCGRTLDWVEALR